MSYVSAIFAVVAFISGLVTIYRFITSHPHTQKRRRSFLTGVIAVILLSAALLAYFSSGSRITEHPTPSPSPNATGATTAPIAEKPPDTEITTKDECINGGVSGVSLFTLNKPPGIIQIESGTDTFSALSPVNKAITVPPEASLSGQIEASILDQAPTYPDFLIGTPSWGDDSKSYWTIRSLLNTQTSTMQASISLIAPAQPGVYFIIFAFQLEISGDYVASATNWSVGKAIWHDGNDIAEFTSSQIGQAQQFGCTINKRLFPDGFQPSYQPADAISINVQA
jgi:hypothetical protein